MFDTVRLLAMDIVLEKDKFEGIENLKTSTYLDNETGELTNVYVITNHAIPYIKYNSTHHRIEIEVSIPKLLFTNNIMMLNTKDIGTFFDTITHQLYELLGCNIDKSEWICKRVDVCWNFQVGAKVDDYIKQFSLLKFPYRDTLVYNHSESVVWENNSNRTTLYNKELEVKKNDKDRNLIAQAKGILRFETSPSYNDITSFSPRRLAFEVLTREFFIFITRKFSSQLADVMNKEEISLEWILNQEKVPQIERVLGHLWLKDLLGCRTKDLYSKKTYSDRRKLLSNLTPQTVSLPPLGFDYSIV